MRAHIDDRAAGLAALPASDPERAAAYVHAESCMRCREALEDAENLLDLLAAEPLPGPSAPALERAWRSVSAEMNHVRAEPVVRATRGRWSSTVALFSAVAISFLLVKIDTVGTAVAWKIGIECLLIELGAAAGPL